MSLLKFDFLLLTLGRIVQVLVSFVSFKIIADHLDAAEVGRYFLLISIATWFGLILVNPLGVYMNRQLYVWIQHKKLVTSTLLFAFFLVGVAMLAAPFGLIFALYVFSVNLNNSFVPALNLLNRRLAFVLLLVLTQTAGLGFSYCQIRWFGSSAEMWLLGQMLALLPLGIFALIFLGSSAPQEPKILLNMSDRLNTVGFNRVFKFAFPVMLTNVGLWCMTQAYRPISESFRGLEFLAMAGMGLGLSSSLSTTVEYLLQQLLLPQFYKNIATDDLSIREMAWNQYAKRIIPLFVFMAIAVSFLAPLLVPLLTNEQYAGAAYFLAIGIWADAFRATNNVFTLIGQSELTTSKTIAPYAVGVGLTILPMVTLGSAPQFDKILPWCLVAGQFGTLIGLYLVFRRKFHVALAWKDLLYWDQMSKRD